MALLDDIKQDIQDITSDIDEFAVSLTLLAPTGETVTLGGLHTKHHLGFDSDSGRDVNTKNAHISFSEKLLLTNNPSYPVRNVRNEVYLEGHKVTAKDSTGVEVTYRIATWFPDETVGLIMCTLSDWKA